MLHSLWTPTTVGDISLPHRLVMAPMPVTAPRPKAYRPS